MAITWNGGCGEGGGPYLAGAGIDITGGTISALRNQNNTYTKTEVDNKDTEILSSIAKVEDGTVATSPYAIGDYVVVGGKTYAVIQPIAVGDTFIPGTNISRNPVSIGAVLTSHLYERYTFQDMWMPAFTVQNAGLMALIPVSMPHYKATKIAITEAYWYSPQLGWRAFSQANPPTPFVVGCGIMFTWQLTSDIISEHGYGKAILIRITGTIG